MSSVDQAANPPGYEITPAALEPPILFVDHQTTGRSGHLGHAMFQRADGKLFAFYPNCSSDDPGRHGTSGHSAVGWMEYKISEDAGLTWGAPQVFDYSRCAIEKALGYAIFTEKAVVTDKGSVVLFHLLSDISEDALWEPYLVPTSTRSADGGNTWSEAVEIGAKRGRIYSATFADGVIYALKFDNDAEADFCGTTNEHRYVLYASYDDGLTFGPISVLPFDTQGRGYGTMCRRNDGSLIVYIYNKHAEDQLDYVISEDGGKSWSAPALANMARRIRNPQMVAFGGGFFMHGRSGSYGPPQTQGHFVLYHSRDGIEWDQGRYLAMRQHGQGAYSNSLVVRPVTDDGVERLRIQASHAYSADSTNVVAWWINKVAS